MRTHPLSLKEMIPPYKKKNRPGFEGILEKERKKKRIKRKVNFLQVNLT